MMYDILRGFTLKENWMIEISKRIRVIVAVLLCVMMLCCAGCNISKEQKETQSQVKITRGVEKIKNSVDVKYNDGFEKVQLSHEFMEGKSVSSKFKQDDFTYGIKTIYINDLIKDDNVKSVEYSLSNCVGTFMDEYLEVQRISIRESVIVTKSMPYLWEKESSENVYFTVYYYCRNASDDKEKKIEEQECIKYLRITADITYEDDSVEKRMYGIDYKSDNSVSVSNMLIYELR